MFNCAKCSKPTGPKVKPIVIVTETRNVDYTNVVSYYDDYDNRKTRQVESSGTEIVKESRICEECFNRLKHEKSNV